MTISRLFKENHLKIRLPFWNERAYAEIYRVDDTHMGPWLTIYDPCCEGIPGIEYPAKILIAQADCADWEAVKS